MERASGIPHGFHLGAGGGGARLLLRAELEPFREAIARMARNIDAGGTLAESGRGRTLRLELPDGTVAAARPYRHGGAAAVLGRVAIGWRRGLREVRASEAARARGVATPLVLGLYGPESGRESPVLMTRLVAGTPLPELLGASIGARRRAARAVATCMATAFRAGLVHPDLNLSNFLVEGADGDEPARAWLLDLDGARVRDVLSALDRRRMLRRMARSYRKLRVLGAADHPHDALVFLVVLARADGAIRRELPDLMRNLHRPFPTHEVLWRRHRARSAGASQKGSRGAS